MENKLAVFEVLNSINVNDKKETKKSGKNELAYLSWAWAWAEVKKRYPEAQYVIYKFENNLPYVYDELTGYMVFTSVTIEGITHEMWLPVMDSNNKAMKSKPYCYKVKEYSTEGYFTGNYIDKTVECASMFDINKTIMRCLTKNLGMFGLGLYIYAGEDLPESEIEEKKRNTADNVFSDIPKSYNCSNCAKEITQAEYAFSLKNFKKSLCRECQKLEKEKNTNAIK